MKIKKVDDKPMVIHKKERVKLHIRQIKKASIMAANIFVRALVQDTEIILVAEIWASQIFCPSKVPKMVR